MTQRKLYFSNLPFSFSDYAMSTLYGYILIFWIICPLIIASFAQEGFWMRIGMGFTFGLMSLVFAVPVYLTSLVVGYPAAKQMFLRLPFGYIPKVILSSFVASVLVILSHTLLLCLLLDKSLSLQGYSGGLVFIGIPTLVVSFVSSVIFIYRTK